MGQNNSHITGEFNAHPNLRKCKLIKNNGEVIPWCNIVDWRYNPEPSFQEYEFEYKPTEPCKKEQTEYFSIMFSYGSDKIFDQMRWNEKNCGYDTR